MNVLVGYLQPSNWGKLVPNFYILVCFKLNQGSLFWIMGLVAGPLKSN